MATRRHVLMSIGVSTIGAVSPVAAGAAEFVPLPIRTLFDTRFTQTRAFARAMKEAGSATHGFAGDVTDLWVGTLAAEWQRQPRILAGMTTPGPLFCLERWAWDVGMRVRFRIDHLLREDGSVVHQIASAIDDSSITRILDNAGDSYPKRMAEILLHDVYPQACCANAAGLSAAGTSATPLVTWIIAPRAEA